MTGSAAAPTVGDVPTVPRVMDEDVQDTLARYIGAERLGPLLDAFRHEMELRLRHIAGPETTATDVAGHAHLIVGMAGQLGFAELSAVCARLERSVVEASLRDDVRHLRAVAARALAAAAGSRYAA